MEHAADVPAGKERVGDTRGPPLGPGHLPREAGQEDVRRIVGAERPFERVRGVLPGFVVPGIALRVLCAVVMKAGVCVPPPGLEPPGEAPPQPEPDGMVLTLPRRDTTP